VPSPIHRRSLLAVLLTLLVAAVACTPAPEPTSVIGTVVDADTLAPLDGAIVVARGAGTGDVAATDTSDAEGAFALTPLAAGVYDVDVERFGYAPQARTDVTTLAGATADLGVIALVRHAPSRMYGSASSDEAFSMPLAGVRVAARVAGTDTEVAIGFTDEHGAFDLAPVPAGTYDVDLSKSGYVPLRVAGVVAPPGGAANVGDLKLLPAAP
jgi:hypothetical protein